MPLPAGGDQTPPPDTKHWTVRRKAAVVEAVRVGMISLQEACLRYDLSVEEFLACSGPSSDTAYPVCAPLGCRSIAVPKSG
jgi:hypothetical protein